MEMIMGIKHQRLGVAARWLGRCPKCGEWFALHAREKEENLSGVHREYACSHCNAEVRDWSLSDHVKF